MYHAACLTPLRWRKKKGQLIPTHKLNPTKTNTAVSVPKAEEPKTVNEPVAEVSPEATPIETPKEVIPKPEIKIKPLQPNQVSSMSLSSIKKKKDWEQQQKPTEVVKDLPTETFSEEDLLSFWNSYQTMKFEKGDQGAREARLFEHLKLLYSKAYLDQLSGELALMKKQGMDELYEKTMKGFLDRLCNLKHFMKELKERFSRWFNKRHGRRGTLWQDRYRSILVEDGKALQTMAAYIDLNPLRAGLVADPKDYRWCGYAEAVAGSKRARIGICRVVKAPLDSWGMEASERYRRLLLSEGIEHFEEKSNREAGKAGKGQRVKTRRGFEREMVLEKLKKGVPLSRGEILRSQVKYFSEGKVIGTKDYVEQIMAAKREWFGKERTRKPQEIPISGHQLYRLR